MRKRSGALHSDHIHEYLQLSQRAFTKIGIFYKEKPHRNNKIVHIKPKQNDSGQDKNNINNFDFNREAQSLLDEAKIKPTKISTINFMIILEQNIQIEKMIKAAFQIEQDDIQMETMNNNSSRIQINRKVDLLIKNKLMDDEEIIYKIWLNFQPQLSVFQTYYKYIENYILIQKQDQDTKKFQLKTKQGPNSRNFSEDMPYHHKINKILVRQIIMKSRNNDPINFEILNIKSNEQKLGISKYSNLMKRLSQIYVNNGFQRDDNRNSNQQQNIHA